jgi:hypothetical protein
MKVPSKNQPYYEGNVQLMEARFLELASSIRALYKSTQELWDILDDNNGPEDHDPDFIAAIAENQNLIVKQRDELNRVVDGMRNVGANVDVPDDIQVMEIKRYDYWMPSSSTGNNPVTSFHRHHASTSANNSSQEATRTNNITMATNRDAESLNDTDEDDNGFYL